MFLKNVLFSHLFNHRVKFRNRCHLNLHWLWVELDSSEGDYVWVAAHICLVETQMAHQILQCRQKSLFKGIRTVFWGEHLVGSFEQSKHLFCNVEIFGCNDQMSRKVDLFDKTVNIFLRIHSMVVLESTLQEFEALIKLFSRNSSQRWIYFETPSELDFIEKVFYDCKTVKGIVFGRLNR